MSLDIGSSLGEGVSRTFAKNGLVLAAVFAGIAFLTTVLTQTLSVGFLDASIEFFQGVSPQELDVTQAEYDEALEELETTAETTRQTSPLALGLPVAVSAGGLLVLALFAEAASIVAVRVFATEETETISGELVRRNVGLATLNGFVGGIVVWVLIFAGLVLFVVPGLFLAVVFLFLRQEIALNDKNFIQAMADSWRTTKGNRFPIFGLGVVVVVVSLLGSLPGVASSVVSPVVVQVLSALLGGVLTIFGAATFTRAYVQLTDETLSEQEPEDPYDAALDADDLA